MRLNVYAATLALAITACASAPTAPIDAEYAAADFGPLPANYQAIVKAYYAATLKDPNAAQYRAITPPKKYWYGDRATGGHYGYLVCATVNAKNSYGGYVGFKTDGFFLRDGAITRYLKDAEFGGDVIC